MAKHTNEERADRARVTCAVYAALGDEDSLLRETVVDLLADLRHLARVEGFDFERASSMAEIHANSEGDEEGGEGAAVVLDEPEIVSILTLSTAHLPAVLNGPAAVVGEEPGDPIVEELPNGWRLYVGCDEPGEDHFGKLWPAVCCARALGCRWIEFDRDGDEHPPLPRWDDEGEPV